MCSILTRVLGLGFLVLLSCGAAKAATVTVEARDNYFLPSSVSIVSGDTVQWMNFGMNPHNVHSIDYLFDSVNPPFEYYEFTFSTPGSYSYYCEPHLDDAMTGSVLVNPAILPPEISIASPTNSAVFDGPVTLTLAATAVDDVSVTNVVFYLGTNVAGRVTTIPYSLTVSNVAPGNFRLSAVATDNDGLSTTSSPVNIVIRHIVTYQDSGFDPNDLTIQIGETVLFTNRGGMHTVTGTGLDPFCGNDMVSSCVHTFNQAGVFGYRCESHQSMTGSVTVIDSNVRPTVSITAPTQDAFLTNKSLVLISANAADQDGFVDRVEFFNGTILLGTATNSPYQITLTNLTNGTYHVRAVTTDNLGGTNASEIVAFRLVSPDVIRPTVTITAPTANARLGSAVALISGKSADNNQVMAVEVELNNSAFSTAMGTTNWSRSVTLAPGTNFIRVRSLDVLGRSSLTNSRTFFYVVTNAINLATNGQGTMAGLTNQQVLEIGRGYKVTATPRPGNLFSNWTDGAGAVVSTTPGCSFLMRSNLVLTANFVANPFVARKGTFNGLFGDTNSIQFTNAGFISLTLADKGAFSGKLLLAGGTHLFTGGFRIDGTATFRVPRTGKPPLTNQLILDLVGTERLTGTVSDGAFQVAIEAERAVFNATNLSPFSGKYTMVVRGSNDVDGTGIATVNVTPGGGVTVSGTLADNTVFTRTTPVSRNGWWPLYSSLYTGKGLLMSWVQFTTNTSRNLQGEAVWIKLPKAGTYYTNGFALGRSMEGGLYSPPAAGPTNLVVTLTNGTATLSSGNLLEPIVDEVTLTNKNVFLIDGTNGLKLTVSTGSGLVNGSFIHPQSKRLTTIKAVVVQGQTNIQGFFLGTNQSGQIRLQP
ncbi:MAG: hypothetical protein H7X97_08425 [Opitutaceae bacterium]|nr:hypothetical protein [Verrucomicrobiales bacterium]